MGSFQPWPQPLRNLIGRNFTSDRQAIEMALLFLVVMSATALLALPLQGQDSTQPPEDFGEGSTGEAAFGATFALLEVGFAATVLVLALVWERLPEWIQTLVKTNAMIGLLMYAGAYVASLGTFVESTLLLMGFVTAYLILDHFSVYWLLNNLFSVALAIYAGLVAGRVFGVWGIGALLVLMTVYDHVFANKKSWMFTIGESILRLRLPVLFVRPSSWRLSWDEMIEGLSQAESDPSPEENDGIGWGIGTADMLLPAAFVSAVVISPGQFGILAALAVIAGIVVACFRLRFEMLSRGSGAGLPALSVGALTPYVVLLGIGVLL